MPEPAPSPTPDVSGIRSADGEPVVDTRIDTSTSCAALANDAADSLTPGGSFLLVADHDPIGIGLMFRAERPGQTTWDVLEAGPERWQVRIGRAAAAAAG